MASFVIIELRCEEQVADCCQSSLMDLNEEPADASQLIPVVKEIANQDVLKKPKEEPLELFSIEEKAPQQNFMGDNICKNEEPEEKYSETVEVEKKRRLPLSGLLNYSESLSHSDEDVEQSGKKSRMESEKKNENVKMEVQNIPSFQPTPQCILCETFPTTACEYATHLLVKHKSTLTLNNIYLICSCGFEFHTYTCQRNHSVECDEHHFTLENMDKKNNSTPQCVQCEMYPSSVYGYAEHLITHHKSTLISNGIYLLCACRQEVRNSHRDPNHTKKCDGLQFNLLKLEEKIHSTPQCILCEIYPTTAPAYAYHLYKHHKSTLKTNGIFLLCACGMEARSTSSHRKHNGECDGRKFTLQKLDNN